MESGGPGGGAREEDQDVGEGTSIDEEGDAWPTREDQPRSGHRQPTHH